MVEDGSAQSTPVWPLPKFYFEVRWDDKVMQFQQVSGLDGESKSIEYRDGGRTSFSSVKMPGIVKTGSITMTKGVFTSGNKDFDWFKEIKMNTIKREHIEIRLLDETGSPTMVWTLQNAFPTKVTGTDLKAEGNGVAVEMIELACEGITVKNKS